jgi:hypothetical protein
MRLFKKIFARKPELEAFTLVVSGKEYHIVGQMIGPCTLKWNNGTWIVATKDNRLYLKGSPKYFDIIISYLENGIDVVLPEIRFMKKQEKKTLAAELDYYGLTTFKGKVDSLTDGPILISESTKPPSCLYVNHNSTWIYEGEKIVIDVDVGYYKVFLWNKDTKELKEILSLDPDARKSFYEQYIKSGDWKPLHDYVFSRIQYIFD